MCGEYSVNVAKPSRGPDPDIPKLAAFIWYLFLKKPATSVFSSSHSPWAKESPEIITLIFLS